ncbi:MAG: metallophosphoesterase [Methylomonas sp.]|nr:MAG: metallophosphoesterase [Methylomonas sp.]PPD26635.1 MAG: metallophosphoesterase [Methylomonas sp.]PPD38423.1 MAG: metallophosphoesterase [Methylomonas sp.]PPD40449.1 MAG: metallophosphoesterase [Methylomonas sp.]PPD53249.1 MAG: metallophosphoesterase [Methylomonas sp.]
MGFGAAPNALALDDFRILPYLQQPGSNGMLFTWFTETDQSGSLTINGAGLASPLIFSSLPSHQANLRYTQAELAQTIPGLTPGSWLFSNENYKHSVDVRGLQADSTYTYTVTQGSSVFTREFKTAPTAQDWSHVRFIAMSDSETEPRGRVTYREWQPGEIASGNRPSLSSSQWATLFGTSGSGANQMLRYALTETEGYKHNLAIVDSRNPDFIVMPGDLVQGGGYQPGWDEFFKHNAGAFDDVLTKRAIIPALGNWENFGALNGGYGAFNDPTFGNDVFAPLFGREKYKTYFDMPENGTPNHRGNYYRVDYGPVTIITLDSSNGEPEDRPQNYGGTGQTPKLVGQEYTGPGTDTQNNFTRAQYESFGGNDLSDFNPGSTQWEWTRSQLQEAREQGQVVFVQFHHAPYSDGEHGLPMNHAQTTGQGGTPMRPYHSMFERFGVAAVLSGHSEMFERSFVDNDGDGIGVHYYDVGAAGDGLRGERRNSPGFGNNRLQYNSFSQWSSDEHEPEVWNIVNGIEQLIAGGKHYGHLEVNLYKRDDGYDLLELIPVYSFPFLDDQYQLLGAERRIYGDTIQLFITENGSVKPVPLPSAIWFLGSGLIWLLGFARKR